MSKKDFGDHLDHTFELSLDDVRERAVRGVVAIMGRGFFIMLVAQISQFVLLAILTPEEMGVFWVVSAAVGFLVFFSDIGLAAALIQKKSSPTEKDLKTTFTVQQTLVVSLLVILYFLTPNIADAFNLNQEGIYLMYALGIGLLFSSLKSIPSVLLERKLAFGRFIIPDIVESLVYSFAAVYFALQGYGIMSFAYAVLLRGVVGLVTIYILQPWVPGIAFSLKAIKELFKFGVPYQFNTFIALIKDRGMTLALSAVLGNAGVGYIGTSERISQTPLRLFLDPITKVTFPAFSRMQSSKTALARSVTQSLKFITFAVYPAVVGFLIVAPVLLTILPQYQKWEPSLTPLLFMTISVMFAAPTTQLTNMLMAIGKITTVTKLTLMWAILTIILVPMLGLEYGIDGAAIGYAIVSSTSVIAVYVAKKHINFSVIDGIAKPLVSTVAMALAVLMARTVLAPNTANLMLMVAIGAVTYLAASYFIIGPSVVKDGKRLAKLLIKK